MREYLKKLRKEKGLSQEDVAKRLGIREPAYCMIERGYRQEDMKLSTLIGIAEIFEVKPEEIMRMEMGN